jgi:hypothetical protein
MKIMEYQGASLFYLFNVDAFVLLVDRGDPDENSGVPGC